MNMTVEVIFPKMGKNRAKVGENSHFETILPVEMGEALKKFSVLRLLALILSLANIT